MSDLAGGRYPDSFEEWLLDGSPTPPYRQTISRRDITTAAIPTVTTLNVYAVAVQAGDIFNYVSFLVKTAGGTLTHSWVALYNGVGTGAALLAQSTDNTTATGWAVGGQKIQLASTVANIGTIGTPQGGGSAAITPNGPAIWGVGVYQSGTTVNLFDAMPGSGAANGAVAVAGQAPMVTKSGAIAATGTAPAVLPAMTPGNGPVPYLLLSRQ